MLRRNGRFRQSVNPATAPEVNDTPATIETKWKDWVEEESYKRCVCRIVMPEGTDVYRLAMHVLIRDAQTSLSLLTPPLISYAEFSVTMPAPRSLWNAKTSQEWKDLYLATYEQDALQLPSLRTFMNDVCLISNFQTCIDVQVSSLAVLSGLWSLSWQYREWKSVLQSPSSSHSRNNALITTSLYQEILLILEAFEVGLTDLPEGLQPITSIVYQQQLMHLHVSLEDVQLLAGKAGEKEARRVFPLLVTWAQGQESRQAVWHAGQILRVVKDSQTISLNGSSAVAVYHASLVFWAYSVVSKSSPASEAGHHQDQSAFSGGNWQKLDQMQATEDKIDLCAKKGPAFQRFITLGKGLPAIQNFISWSASSNASQHQSLVLLEDTNAVMTEIIQLLLGRNNAESRVDNCPSLVENLARLMKTLGNAASVIHLR